jgi:HAMP domain-containing protein
VRHDDEQTLRDSQKVVVMNLAVKVHLVLAGTLAAGLTVCAGLAYQFLNVEANARAVENSRLVIETANAAHSYTGKRIKPLLEAQLKYEFQPESKPNFAAIQLLSALQKGELNLSYKEVALNPTNPRDRASEWESGVITRLRKDDKLSELTGESDTPAGRVLYLARPITVTDAACLQCHGAADAAPQTVLDKYGKVNGFGWQMNETIGAQIVAMPSAERGEQVLASWRKVMLALGAVFATLFVGLSVLLTTFVIRPVSRLAALADKVSLDDEMTVPLEARGNDEVAVLTRAFERVRTSLARAMAMIEG